MAELQKKQDKMDIVMKMVGDLQKQYEDNKREKDRLDSSIRSTAVQLENAAKLTTGLASEQIRWAEQVQKLTRSREQLLGDSFVSATCIAYHGPFSGQFRSELIERCKSELENVKISVSEEYNFVEKAGNVSTISN